MSGKRKYTDEELLTLLREFGEELGSTPTKREVKAEESMPGETTYYHRFGSYNEAVREAGLEPNSSSDYPKEELLRKLAQFAEQLGKPPTGTEVNEAEHMPMSKTYARNFGGWKEALVAAGIVPENAIRNRRGRYSKEDRTREEIIEMMEECMREHQTVSREVFCEHYVARHIVEDHFDTFSAAKRAAGFEASRLSDEQMKELDAVIRADTRLREIADGLLLGDGCIDCGADNNGLLSVGMIRPQFLAWVDEQFGAIGLGVTKRKTAMESARRARKTGFRPDAREENYHDFYLFRTRRLPFFTEQKQRWYPNGQKRFPDDLTLTPTIARMWYCGDGGINIRNGTAEIRCKTQSDRPEYLVGLFESAGFDPTYRSERIHLRNESKAFLDWIGDPLPGFEYKWEIDDEEAYRRLKDGAVP